MTTIEKIQIAERQFIPDELSAGYLADIVFPFLDNRGIIYFNRKEIEFSGGMLDELQSVLTNTLKELFSQLYKEPSENEVQSRPTWFERITFDGIKYRLNYTLSGPDRMLYILTQIADTIEKECADGAVLRLFLSEVEESASKGKAEFILEESKAIYRKSSGANMRQEDGGVTVDGRAGLPTIIDYALLILDYPFVWYYNYSKKYGKEGSEMYAAAMLYFLVATVFVFEYTEVNYPLRYPFLLLIYLALRFFPKNSMRKLEMKYEKINSHVIVILRIYSAALLLFPLYLLLKGVF